MGVFLVSKDVASEGGVGADASGADASGADASEADARVTARLEEARCDEEKWRREGATNVEERRGWTGRLRWVVEVEAEERATLERSGVETKANMANVSLLGWRLGGDLI